MRASQRFLLAVSVVALLGAAAAVLTRTSDAVRTAAAPAPATERQAEPDVEAMPEAEGHSDRRREKSLWRDPGIYVDGQPVGVLTFGELPVTLRPVFREAEVSAEIQPGEKAPGFRIAKERVYRFVELFHALGVDLAKVKEVHLYGPRFTDSVVATGAQVRRNAQEFMFRFSGSTGGQPLPIVPYGFGNGRSPDKITAVLVYVNKPPPRLMHNEGFFLDGVLQTQVPYYGEPLRGGVRIYQDDRLVFSLKRRHLHDLSGGGAGSLRLAEMLRDNGVDLERVVEAWLIHDGLRTARFTAAQLTTLTFQPGRRGDEVLVGDQKLPAGAIALHARTLGSAELPQLLPEEQL
jgi:hypothetical protein